MRLIVLIYWGGRMIKLGDWEFKAEDFVRICFSEDYARQSAETANRILREKLKKAPLIYLERAGTWGGAPEDVDLYNGTWSRTSRTKETARLVCIAPIMELDEEAGEK